MKGFADGFSRAGSKGFPDVNVSQPRSPQRIPATLGRADLDQLLLKLKGLPWPVQDIAFAGLKRVIDFQDVAYGSEYLDRLQVLIEKDRNAGGEGHHFAFSAAAAKYLATAMAYDDVIGVADLKIRSGRFARIARDMNAAGHEPIYFTEFMHPRADELAGLLPAKIGARVAASVSWMRRLDRWFNRGRHIETAKLSGFLQLYAVSSLRRFRRRLYRHAGEVKHLETWLSCATNHLPHNYELALGIIRARRLVKGYSDTHARGLSKFDRVLSSVPMLETRNDAGAWMDRLIAAALKDEDGDALDGALQTLKSL
jgi:indolepyruvate ferredoxin oxidoreductase beta subunit